MEVFTICNYYKMQHIFKSSDSSMYQDSCKMISFIFSENVSAKGCYSTLNVSKIPVIQGKHISIIQHSILKTRVLQLRSWSCLTKLNSTSSYWWGLELMSLSLSKMKDQRRPAYVPYLTQCASLLIRLKPPNYRKATDPQNWDRNGNYSGRQNSMHGKSRAKLRQSKSDESPHTHFIEHLMCVTNNPQAKYKKNGKNLSIWSNDFGTRPAEHNLKWSRDASRQPNMLPEKLNYEQSRNSTKPKTRWACTARRLDRGALGRRENLSLGKLKQAENRRWASHSNR
jgi:hypothetical protein